MKQLTGGLDPSSKSVGAKAESQATVGLLWFVVALDSKNENKKVPKYSYFLLFQIPEMRR